MDLDVSFATPDFVKKIPNDHAAWMPALAKTQYNWALSQNRPNVEDEVPIDHDKFQ